MKDGLFLNTSVFRSLSLAFQQWEWTYMCCLLYHLHFTIRSARSWRFCYGWWLMHFFQTAMACYFLFQSSKLMKPLLGNVNRVAQSNSESQRKILNLLWWLRLQGIFLLVTSTGIAVAAIVLVSGAQANSPPRILPCVLCVCIFPHCGIVCSSSGRQAAVLPFAFISALC